MSGEGGGCGGVAETWRPADPSSRARGGGGLRAWRQFGGAIARAAAKRATRAERARATQALSGGGLRRAPSNGECSKPACVFAARAVATDATRTGDAFAGSEFGDIQAVRSMLRCGLLRAARGLGLVLACGVCRQHSGTTDAEPAPKFAAGSARKLAHGSEQPAARVWCIRATPPPQKHNESTTLDPSLSSYPAHLLPKTDAVDTRNTRAEREKARGRGIPSGPSAAGMRRRRARRLQPKFGQPGPVDPGQGHRPRRGRARARRGESRGSPDVRRQRYLERQIAERRDRTGRGDAAATTCIFRGDSRTDRGTAAADAP